jgi:hypothetical protein
VERLADSKAEIYAARSMVLDAARRRDNGLKVSTEASCAKLFASEMCGRVADRAVQIFGGAGYVSDYGIERFYRDVRLFRIYEGTTQIQQLVTLRRRTVEHVFGTLKHWMRTTHFLTRRIENVSTEMSLHVLAYNLKRVMQLLGIAKTTKAMKLIGA